MGAPIFVPLFHAGPPSRCLEALIVAVKWASDMRTWSATKELQLASFQLCAAFRGANAVHLRVDGDTPAPLLAVVGAPYGGDVSSRVPRVRARRVTWELLSVDLLSILIDPWIEVEELYFGSAFDGSLDVRVWPSRLRVITFGEMSPFNQPIAGLVWPERSNGSYLGLCSTRRSKRSRGQLRWSNSRLSRRSTNLSTGFVGPDPCRSSTLGAASTSRSKVSSGRHLCGNFASGIASTSPSKALRGQSRCGSLTSGMASTNRK